MLARFNAAHEHLQPAVEALLSMSDAPPEVAAAAADAGGQHAWPALPPMPQAPAALTSSAARDAQTLWLLYQDGRQLDVAACFDCWVGAQRQPRPPTLSLKTT